jgi:hypothetical protein
MCSGCSGYHSKNQPAPERLHKNWQKHQGPGSSSNRSRGRSISSCDRQHYNTCALMDMVVLQQVQSHLGMMMAESMRSVFWLGRLVVRSVVWLDLMFAHLYLHIGILLRPQSCLDSAIKMAMMCTWGCNRLLNRFRTLNNHMMATNGLSLILNAGH